MLSINIQLAPSRKGKLFVDHLFFSWRNWNARRMAGLPNVRELQGAERDYKLSPLSGCWAYARFFAMINCMSSLHTLNNKTELSSLLMSTAPLPCLFLFLLIFEVTSSYVGIMETENSFPPWVQSYHLSPTNRPQLKWAEWAPPVWRSGPLSGMYEPKFLLYDLSFPTWKWGEWHPSSSMIIIIIDYVPIQGLASSI